jgi:CO/xanthine dehydrogenase Mo-binding subunit
MSNIVNTAMEKAQGAAMLGWQGDELVVHDSSQGVQHVAWSLAQVFGLKEEQVHVTLPFVGGGFGGKTLWQHQILAAAASKLAGRPVRIMLSREGVYRVVGGRAPTEQRVALGAQSDGRLDALVHTGVVAMTSHNKMPEPFILPTQSAYAAGASKLDVQVADIDMEANTFMRAPGESVGTFALESAIDELAVALGMDPIELRPRNEPDKDPTIGRPFSSRHIVEASRAGAKRFGWSARQAVPGGSQQSAAIGASIVVARKARVIELLKLCDGDSPLKGLGEIDVRCRDAGLCKADEPERFETYAAILARALREGGTVEATAPPPLETQRWSMHAWGAMFCEVRANAVTGEPRVSRFLGSFDCGRILNAKTARSQFRGGIVMGLGLALMEEAQFDERNGRLMNPSLAEYHVPVHLDVPEIDVIWNDIPDPHTPMGARAAGEIGITGTGAAVANASFSATGRRVRELSITLDKLLSEQGSGPGRRERSLGRRPRRGWQPCRLVRSDRFQRYMAGSGHPGGLCRPARSDTSASRALALAGFCM